jgi:branched-chain amino acid aminotransferase
MADYVMLNGQLTPYEAAWVPAGDAGLLHGAGVFETMRARQGKVFRLRQHLERMTRSAQALAIAFALEEEQLREMVAELLDANDMTDARLRLTVTRGDVHAATAEEPVPPVTLLLTATAFAAYPAELYEKGMTVVVSASKQNPENPTTGHKVTSYFDRLLALREAQLMGAGEALWFTAGTNYLAEGCISNVFLVDKEGILCTPPLMVPVSTGNPERRLCLPGVTRQVVLEAATAAGILPHERMLTINDVLGAREVFLTNAIMGVMPVTRVESHEVGEGKVGAMTTLLRGALEAELQSHDV